MAAPKVGERAPDFSLPSLDGPKVTLSQLKGSIVVIDFWASWCGPCKKELPELNALAQKYAGANPPVVIVAIGIDKERANAEKLVRALKLSGLRILLDPEGRVASAYDLPTMPSSFVVDASGLVQHVHVGFTSGDEKVFATEIDGLLQVGAQGGVKGER